MKCPICNSPVCHHTWDDMLAEYRRRQIQIDIRRKQIEDIKFMRDCMRTLKQSFAEFKK